MRTPVSLLFAVLLATAIVSAANVTLTPSSIYETTSVWETIDVNNYKGSSIISEVKAETTILPIIDSESYTGLTKVQDSDSVTWKDGSIETNVKSAVFEFKVTAPNVSADTTESVTISLDSAGKKYNITILNDPTPPNISNVQPNNYAKANNPAQTVSATAIDAETSVSAVTYTWNNCENGTDTIITLTKSGDTYTGIADFTGYDEGEKACYTVTATNAPGEKSTKTGELQFDGTAPTVSISAPTTFATEKTTFSFTATDNVATKLGCVLKLDSTELGQYNATNGIETSETLDLSNFSEGSYTWSVTCADGVGLTATHAQAIILDTKPPVITIAYNTSLPRTQTQTITATIKDTIGLANVTATFNGNDIALTQSGNDYTGSISADTLGTKTFEIKAVDNVGHNSSETKTITIVPNHHVTLTLAPSTTTAGTTVIASGTLTKDGNTTVNDVTIKTPDKEFMVELDENNAYSIPFSAPDPGTYVVTTEYTEDGYTYKVESTLTVQSPNQQRLEATSGIGAEAWRTSGYVKPHEANSGGSNAVVPDEPVQNAPEPAPKPEYVPLPAEEPRSALTPKATGVFTLKKGINWLAPLLALALIAGIGIFAYRKRPKDDSGIDWEGYFKGANGT